MDLVSIIIPVYNVENLIERCIKSLINQTYNNTEIILVNDGSTDSSGSICQNWSEHENIIYIDQKNQGVSAARNAALNIAHGKYIMFVDSDDWCEPDMVECMINAIRNSNTEFAQCTYFINSDNHQKAVESVYQTGEYTLSEVYAPLFFGKANEGNKSMSASLCLGIFSADIIKQYHIRFDPYIRYAEDWLFYAEYFQHVHSIAIVSKPLYHYYQRSNSAMHQFIPTSKLGVEKSCYILNRFEEIAKSTANGTLDYQPYLRKRYIGLILNQAKNVWNRQSPLRCREKSTFLRTAIRESEIGRILMRYQHGALPWYDRFWLHAIQHENIMLISVYGITYNILRDVRNRIKNR